MTMPGSKSEIMKLYFSCMDSADFETAASLFALDATYVRPPFVPGQAAFASSGTQTIDGLEDIKAFWALRGRRNTDHKIVVEGSAANEWFAEGAVSVDDSETRLFLCHVSFSDDQKIRRFVALR